MPLSPRDSAVLIAQHAKDVAINDSGVSRLANLIFDDLRQNKFSMLNWKQHEVHPKDANEKAVDWIFLIDTLNFSFWSETNEKYEVVYKGKTYTGYFSICAAINRAIEEGIPICEPQFYAHIDEQLFTRIMRSSSNIEIPMLKERYHILRETGQILLKNFQGSFTTCIQQCENSCEKLLQLVVQYFPSYRDEAVFEGQEVSFYKRAQILIGDLWSCFEGKGFGAFNDIDKLTMFADYRIPQVLVYFNALKYSENLNMKLQSGHLFENGDREEVEIRGCTILCVDKICQLIKNMQKDSGDDLRVNAVLVDNFLWDYRRANNEEMANIPYHKVRCIYY